jgi:hypothetical protein
MAMLVPQATDFRGVDNPQSLQRRRGRQIRLLALQRGQPCQDRTIVDAAAFRAAAAARGSFEASNRHHTSSGCVMISGR